MWKKHWGNHKANYTIYVFAAASFLWAKKQHQQQQWRQQQRGNKNISTKKSEFWSIFKRVSKFTSLHHKNIKTFFASITKLRRQNTLQSVILPFALFSHCHSLLPLMLTTAYIFWLKREYFLQYIHVQIHLYHWVDERWWKCTCNNFIKPHTYGRIVRILRDRLRISCVYVKV